MTTQLITTAKQIVNLGIGDPDLFVAMALFEEGFGPDRISDMATNVILGDLIAFNHRILAQLPVPRAPTTIRLRSGISFPATLPRNPFVNRPTPVILVPTDILRDLPIAKDWGDVGEAAARNNEIRHKVNEQIAKLWERKTLQDKDTVKRWALGEKDNFETLLEMLHGAFPKPYDIAGDPLGELVWRRIAAEIAGAEPFKIRPPARLDLAGVANVVEQIIEQFRFLIEERRLSEELYYMDRHRPKKSVQKLFFAIAFCYCKANNIDITPEADTGNGPVDFKFSLGFNARVLVEIKLSANTRLVRGYESQLGRYKTAEETLKAYYLIVDVGQMGKKAEALFEMRRGAASRGEPVSDIVIIDGSRRSSASKD